MRCREDPPSPHRNNNNNNKNHSSIRTRKSTRKRRRSGGRADFQTVSRPARSNRCMGLVFACVSVCSSVSQLHRLADDFSLMAPGQVAKGRGKLIRRPLRRCSPACSPVRPRAAGLGLQALGCRPWAAGMQWTTRPITTQRIPVA